MSNERKTRVSKMDIDYNYYSPFPTILRQLLEGSTQDELATYVGVARQSVAQWKDGKTKPDIYYLGKIADFYNVSTDYLLGRTAVKSLDMDAQSICNKTGLSEKSVEFLENHKKDYFKIKMINYLFEKPVIIALITNYFFEFLGTKIHETEYKYIPLRSMPYAQLKHIAFSVLIESLPQYKSEIEKSIITDDVLLQEMLLEYLKRNADIVSCNKELGNINEYDYYDDYESTEDNSFEFTEDYIEEYEQSIEEYERSIEEFIEDERHAKEQDERKFNAIEGFLNYYCKQKKV